MYMGVYVFYLQSLIASNQKLHGGGKSLGMIESRSGVRAFGGEGEDSLGKGGSSKSAGVEVHTAPGMQMHFRLDFD